MSPLSNDQKKLLFDYCLDLTSEEQAAEAQALISNNNEAAEIYSKIKSSLEPLESVEAQICPEDLVESTISLLNKNKHSSQQQLEQLLAVEQTKKVPVRIGFWRNLVETAAIAASIMLIVGIVVPTMGYARQKHWQKKCGVQMSGFFQGLSNYMADHDGSQPSIASTAGAPWWKIGYQGKENQSNTRRIYILVRDGYVKPEVFICPGNKASRNLKIETSKIGDYKDFPDRSYVTYSFQISCRTKNGKLLCRNIIMADSNPLFEVIPNFDSTFRVRLNKDLLDATSRNHKKLDGQNVLFGDGRVEFLESRRIGIAQDDIFTLQDTDIYHGVEVPSCETDFFLAP